MSVDIKANIYTKGLIKDLNESFVSDQMVTHARNALLSTHKGDSPIYSNEPSNLACYTLPYKFNGEVSLKDNRFFVCSSDNINNEIGILDLNTCEYTKLVNSQCLNFNNNYIVTGIVKQDIEGNEIVMFNDGYNPPRILNLSHIPYTYTTKNDDCNTKVYSTNLDCDALLLSPHIKIPCITLEKNSNGTIPDGVYQVGIAYSIEGIKFSDIYSLTTPLMINNKSGDSSITVLLDNVDQNFEQFQLYLVGTVEGITTNKMVGTYNISTNNITISDWHNQEYQTVSSIEFTTTKKNYSKAGIITNNSQYAMFADLTRKPDINVQKIANDIKLVYTVTRYPENYYKEDGTNIGYYRNERYRFYIRYLHKDGEPTKSGVIPNRLATAKELERVVGDDVYETYTKDECAKETKVPYWQVYNTAGTLVSEPGKTSSCGVYLGFGEFGYAESTELYPDDKELFGDNACTPQRLHLFPDEIKVPRYTVDSKTGQKYINVLGIKVLNVPKPKDEKGNIIEDIVGYEILRSNRDSSNKTVISRGLISNMRSYEEKNQGTVLYSNYPYNDLTPDQFISKKQVYKDNKGVEKNYEPLDTIHLDKLSFYSPHNYFFEKKKLGTELRIESEEIAKVIGNFVPVFNHPKHKLLTNHSLAIAGLIGSLEAYLSFQGKTCVVTEGTITQNTTTHKVGQSFVNVCDDSGKAIMPIPVNTANVGTKVKMAISNAAKIVLNSLAFLGVAADFANKFLDQVRNFSKYRQYVYQYNSYAIFTQQKPAFFRRNIKSDTSRYLDSTPENIGNYVVNNYKKEKSLFLDIERGIAIPTTKDNSRRTVTQFGLCKDVTVSTNSTASMYYGTVMIKNPNQYGSIYNINPVKTHNCILPLNEESPVIYGGDCIITRFTINKKQPFFRETIANTNYPDGTAFDYRQHRNIGFPRFFADFTEYDAGSLMNIIGNVLKASGKDIEAALPDQKFNLDCKNNKGKKKDWIIQNQYMYTSYNGVLDFFVECDYNIAYRDNKNEGVSEIYQPHANTASLENVFRSDVIDKEEGFTLDSSYRKLVTTEIFTEQLRDYNKIPLREKNSIIYSLPAFTGQKFNNWQYFLPNNYFTFDEKDFGSLTGIHPIDQDRVIFLFSKSSPFISMGRDQLETASGRKITIGDGGLFAQQPRELIHTDVYYGSSHSKYAFSSTQFGVFYPSEVQGKIFQFDGNLNEVSREGVHKWCRQYMPLQIVEQFPKYTQTNSPQTGVGYLITFDNTYELVYICKRDYSVKEQYKADIIYNETTNKFLYKNLEIALGDSKYFDDASWTLSYSPPNKSFSSYHDWHPDWVIQQENHFTTVKDKTFYKHNQRCDSYCNFYGIDKPYELEVTLSTGQNVNLIRSFEYHNEVYHNHNNCKDRFHVKKENFDQAEIYNTEQHSGLLTLEDVAGRKPSDILYGYPKITPIGLTIPFEKVEQHYRINMFHDMTKDRDADIPMWITESNGYERRVNPAYLNLNREAREKKNIRHYHNSILLRKTVSGPNHFITKYQNFKITNSSL